MRRIYHSIFQDRVISRLLMVTVLGVLVLLGFLFLFSQSILACPEADSRGDISIVFTRNYVDPCPRLRLGRGACKLLVYLLEGTPLEALFYRDERLVDTLFRVLSYHKYRLLDTPPWIGRHHISLIYLVP